MIWTRRQFKSLWHDWVTVARRIHRARIALLEKQDTGRGLSREETEWLNIYRMIGSIFGEDGRPYYKRPGQGGQDSE